MLQHMIYDTLTLEFDLTGGELPDCKAAPAFIDKLPAAEHNIVDSKTGNSDIDWELYKYRHFVENVFVRIKHFRAIAQSGVNFTINHPSHD